LKKRISIYIDGFNLYHSALQNVWTNCKWLDLNKLSGQFINPSLENLNEVNYFSAVAHWIPHKAKKHKEYMNALRAMGVNVILGQFKEKDRKCQATCKKCYKSHEEKETDINIAVQLLSDAFEDKFDTALILSGDSDLAPAVARLKKMFPVKRVGIILPPYQLGADLISKADYVKKIRHEHLRKAILPLKIDFAGLKIIAPKDWY